MAEVGTILYDLSAAQPIGNSPVSGGGAYAERVYRRLLSTIDHRDMTRFPLKAVAWENKYLDRGILELSKEKGIEIIYVRNLVRELVPILSRLKVRIFYSALPLRFKGLKFPAEVKFIYTIHGLRPLELTNDQYEHLYISSLGSAVKYIITRTMPRLYLKKRKKDFRQLINVTGNRQIITVSSHSRYAILSEFPFLDRRDIKTFYSPVDDRCIFPDESVLEELGLIPGEFILLVCGNRWAKNPYRAVLALKGLIKKGLLKKKVLITGRGNAPYLKKIQGDSSFIITDYVSREKLYALYRNACTFIFPTLNEGFGYPPLECMSLGTPVITSPINSLPEVLGDSVLWADPYSIGEMEARILQLMDDGELYSILARKGKERELKIRDKQKKHLDELIGCILSPRFQANRDGESY